MLEFTRRSAVASLAAFIARPACAETQWPNRPLTLLQGYVAGGPTDTVARLVADGLSKRLGQQVIVDSKPGAAGTIAAAQVAKAAPDGYTLMIIPGGHAAAAALYKKLPYRPVDDFSLIGMVAEYPFIFVTYPDHPIKSAGDLIALARARDVPLLYGTPGIGSVHHLSIELFAKQAGIRLNHVPYRGSSQAVTDLIGKRDRFHDRCADARASDGARRAVARVRGQWCGPLAGPARCAGRFGSRHSRIYRDVMAVRRRAGRNCHWHRRAIEPRDHRVRGRT
jgi:tripartite-type tricarboxylate transporter receptor subunit TctC